MAKFSKIDDIQIPIFDGINFSSWKFRIMHVLEYKECVEPVKRKKIETEDGPTWKKLDMKAKTIIISAVSDKQLEYINECRTALEMIKTLENMYETKSTTLQIIKRNKWEEIKLRNYSTVEEFFDDFEKTYNELKKAGARVTDEEKMRYMIKALPQEYCYIGDFIDLVPEKDRTIDLVKAKIQEKNMKRNNTKMNTSTFNVKTNATCYRCGKMGHHMKDCWHTMQYQGRGEQSAYRGQRGQRGRRETSRGYYRGATHSAHGRGRGSNQQTSSERNEVWAAQLMELSVNQLSKNQNNDPKIIEWLLDSGCTHHIVNDKKYLYDYEHLEEPINVILPDGKELKATKIGTVKTIFSTYYNKTEVYLENVFLVEGMKKNLLSCSKITDKNTIIARYRYAKIYNNDKKLIAVATKNDGLYYMESICEYVNENIQTNVTKISEKEKWHRALGHINFQYLNKLVNEKLVNGLPEKLENDKMTCSNCIQSKMANVPFENKRNHAKQILEIIHTDLNGPQRTKGFGGENYFLTFIDEYSKCTKIYCIKSKDETADCFKEYVNLVENKFGKGIKKLQCDNGREYLNREIYEFAREKGIEILPCPPYVHELNGTAERYNRSAMDMGRCLAREAKLDDKYWPEIIKAVAYLKNRTIANTQENKTPFEIFFNRKPSVKHIKIYGSKVYVRIPETLRKGKWDNKAKIGILVGYNIDSYRVLIDNRIINARHVKVIENESELICVENNEDGNGMIVNFNRENENIENENEVEIARKSQRERHPVNRYGNPITHSISVNFVNTWVPNTFEEAISSNESEKWIEAMDSEIKSLNDQKTWTIVERIENKPIIDVKWIYTRKANGRYKARLVVRGFQQKNAIEDIYSPVASDQTLKFLLSFACQNGLILEVIDVDSAFLYGDIVAEVYVNQPKGYNDGTGKVCKLQKSMYGLSESPRDWYKCFDKYIETIGFKRSNIELCLYILDEGDNTVYLVNYVDDVMLGSKNKQKLGLIKELIGRKFKIKDLGEIKEYLGINIEYDQMKNEMKLSQTKYIEVLAEKYEIINSKLYNTPMEVGLKIEKGNETEESTLYRNLLGALLYIGSSTRPDISYSVNYLSRFQNCHNKTHFRYALRILKYLYSTKNLGLCYEKNTKSKTVDCFVDADWAGDNIDRKSTTGYVIRLYGNIIYWKSRKQKSVTKASTFAEYVALSEAVSEIKFIKEVMKIFKISTDEPIKIYEDNSGAIEIAKYGNFTKNSKHIEIHYHFVHEHVKEKEIEICKINSEDNIADILTKSVNRVKFEKFREIMNIKQ